MASRLATWAGNSCGQLLSGGGLLPHSSKSSPATRVLTIAYACPLIVNQNLSTLPAHHGRISRSSAEPCRAIRSTSGRGEEACRYNMYRYGRLCKSSPVTTYRTLAHFPTGQDDFDAASQLVPTFSQYPAIHPQSRSGSNSHAVLC